MALLTRACAAAVALIALGSWNQYSGAPQINPAAAAVPIPRAPQVQQAFALEGQVIQGGLVLGTAPKGTTLLALDRAAVPIAPDGRFVIAFDRDAGPSAVLRATLSNGTIVARTLAVSPRAWDISRLDTLPKYPVPRPEFDRLRPGELAQINAARIRRSDAQGWRQHFLWPVTGRISTLFGSQRIYRGEPGSYHSGIDIARPTGTTVLAPADGVVVLATAAPFTLEGRLVMIDHGMDLSSAFMHLSRIQVGVGERVRRGQPIGAVGMSGRATGPHLHWGMRWRESRIDPLLVTGAMPAAD